MVVYVDDIRIPAKVGAHTSAWSHLTADTRAELHAFAQRLGLKREWFQDPVIDGKPRALPGTRAAENWHYDVTEPKRQAAIVLGAVSVPWREFPQVVSERWRRKQQAYVDYFAHREECWYTGDPSTADGRGCEEHNRLYDAWQAVIC